MARTRTFLGIDIGPTTRSAITRAQSHLARTGAQVKWARPTNLHITLAFLGDIDDTDLAAVCRLAQQVARRTEPFRLSFQGLSAFPNTRRPKTIWVGLADGLEPLQEFCSILAEPLAAMGFRQDDRPFTPHITLGRVSDEASADLLAELLPDYAETPFGQVDLEELLVYNSLSRGGERDYTIVGRGLLGR
ncbi:MAG: RNA 2',3'-cyclic phosphodiesterase [Gemmataceae bacterium]